jgi:hypothetical protein
LHDCLPACRFSLHGPLSRVTSTAAVCRTSSFSRAVESSI